MNAVENIVYFPRGYERAGDLLPHQTVLGVGIFRERSSISICLDSAPAMRLVPILRNIVKRPIVHIQDRSWAARIAQAGCARKDGRKTVVVLRQDRIELMIMAAGAGDCESEERLPCRVDLFIHYVVDHLQPVLLRERFGSDGEESCSHRGWGSSRKSH